LAQSRPLTSHPRRSSYSRRRSMISSRRSPASSWSPPRACAGPGVPPARWPRPRSPAPLASAGVCRARRTSGAGLHGCVPTLRMTAVEKTKRMIAPHPLPATHLAYARQVFDRVSPFTSGRSPCSTSTTRPSPRHGNT
jgi:hypothetical protein